MSGRMKLAGITGALWLALLLGFTAPVLAGVADVQLFQGFYDQFRIAVDKRDEKAMLSFLSPGFMSTELSGETKDAKKMVAAIMALPDSVKPKERKTTVLSASSDGKTGVVEQSYHLVKQFKDASGTETTIEFNTRSHDTWEWAEGTWRMKASRTDEIEMKKNGTTITHQLRPSP